MDLIEEHANLELPISNTEIYKLNEFYSDILFVPPEKIYRSFPLDVKPQEKKKLLFDIFRFTVKWYPYFIIKVEYK
jgi:hypothetical protein